MTSKKNTRLIVKDANAKTTRKMHRHPCAKCTMDTKKEIRRQQNKNAVITRHMKKSDAKNQDKKE